MYDLSTSQRTSGADIWIRAHIFEPLNLNLHYVRTEGVYRASAAVGGASVPREPSKRVPFPMRACLKSDGHEKAPRIFRAHKYGSKH